MPLANGFCILRSSGNNKRWVAQELRTRSHGRYTVQTTPASKYAYIIGARDIFNGHMRILSHVAQKTETFPLQQSRIDSPGKSKCCYVPHYLPHSLFHSYLNYLVPSASSSSKQDWYETSAPSLLSSLSQHQLRMFADLFAPTVVLRVPKGLHSPSPPPPCLGGRGSTVHLRPIPLFSIHSTAVS